MKKLLLVLSVFSLGFFACSDSAETTTDSTEVVEEETTVVEKEETTMDANAASKAVMPEFENEQVTEFVNEFDAYFDEMLANVESGDEAAMEAMKEKELALQKKGEELQTVISDTDKAKMEAYMKERMQSLFAAMMQGAQ